MNAPSEVADLRVVELNEKDIFQFEVHDMPFVHVGQSLCQLLEYRCNLFIRKDLFGLFDCICKIFTWCSQVPVGAVLQHDVDIVDIMKIGIEFADGGVFQS